ncbi:MAG: type 4a pilus biogenesis protein PilO [Candidatus Eisenbacteria sp.]|nr:type 4a pilus biogenesis protein PilO [Candidatus Eisenbacteria bacterium]
MTDPLRKRRWRVALCVGGCIAIWVTWVLLYAIPRFGHIVSIWDNLETTELSCRQLSRETRNLSEDLAFLRQAARALDKRLAALPPHERIPDTARYIAERAGACGLDVIDADLDLDAALSCTPAGTGSGISEVPFSLVVVGTYGEVGRFLESIAESGIFIQYRSIEMERFRVGAGQLEATILMNLFVGVE